jgi:Uma2 family endonuclease
VLGTRENPQLPDLAIEVMWKSGSINELDVYKALGIAEVWIWRNHALTAFVLRDNAYESPAESQLLPGLVLLELASLLTNLVFAVLAAIQFRSRYALRLSRVMVEVIAISFHSNE